jgi:uroporphyrinogen-III synthase
VTGTTGTSEDGPRVWITRTAPGAARTAEAIRDLGFIPVVVPLLEVRPLEKAADLDLGDVAALAFTSVNGLIFADLTLRRDWPVFAVGHRTAQAARDRGFTDVRSAGGDAEDLATLIAREWGARGLSRGPGVLLVPGAVSPSADMAGLLAGRVPVRSMPVYETVETAVQTPAAFDIVLVHSARAAEALTQCLDPLTAAGRTAVALSPQVAGPLEALGFAALRIAARPDETSLLEALGNPRPAV